MKITRVELTDFGKFHNYNLDLIGDFLYLYGPNEGGKTTLFHFISGIFYGFSRDNPTKKIYNEYYDRYKPLHSPNYRGALELTMEGRKYRIERNFLKGDESLKIWDIENRILMEDDSRLYTYSKIPQPGALFFQMDQDTFLNFYALQDLNDFPHKNFLQEGLYKIKNYLEGDHPDVDVEKGLAFFDEEIKAIGSRGKKRSKLGLTSIELNELEKQSAEMFERQDVFEKLTQEQRQVSQALQRFQHDGSHWEEKTTEKSPSQLLAILDRWEQKSGEIVIKYEEIGKKIDTIENEKIRKYQNFQPGREKLFFVASIFSFIAGIVFLAMIRSEQALFALLPTFLFFSVALYEKNKGKKFRAILEKYHQYLAEQDTMMDQVQKMVLEYNDNFRKSPLDKHMEIQDFPQILRRKRSTLLSDLDRDSAKREEWMGEKSREYEKLREREIYLSYKKRDLMREQEKDKQRVEKIDELREQERELLREVELLEMGQKILKNIIQERNESAKFEFLKRSESILKELSQGKYFEIYFDEGDFLLGDGREKYAINYLSTSTKEILLLSLRLAMVSMRRNDGTPLFLDDSFVHLDTSRRQSVHQLLKAIDRQIFFFSLEKPRENWGDEISFISL